MGQTVEQGEGKELELNIAKILHDCRLSLAIHQRKIRELAAIRSKSRCDFASSFFLVLTPLFGAKKTASSERILRFVSAFAARRDGNAGHAFLVQFLTFLLTAARAANKTARLRSCQFISQVTFSLTRFSFVKKKCR